METVDRKKILTYRAAMRRGLLALMVVSALAGCGDSGSAEPSAKDSTSPAASESTTPSPSESGTPSPTITVSTKTTCDQLFGGNGKGPLEVVVDWWSTDEGITVKLSDALDEVEQIAATAGPDLKPFLETIVSETHTASTRGGDATTFKAAGLEVSNVCVDVL